MGFRLLAACTAHMHADLRSRLRAPLLPPPPPPRAARPPTLVGRVNILLLQLADRQVKQPQPTPTEHDARQEHVHHSVLAHADGVQPAQAVGHHRQRAAPHAHHLTWGGGGGRQHGCEWGRQRVCWGCECSAWFRCHRAQVGSASVRTGLALNAARCIT